MDVVWFLAEIERARHAQVVVELVRWVGVDGKWTRCCLDVHVDEFRASTTDNGYESGRREREERFGGDGAR